MNCTEILEALEAKHTELMEQMSQIGEMKGKVEAALFEAEQFLGSLKAGLT